MDELIAKLDAEIAAIQAEVDAVEASIADKRTTLRRLRQAKDSLTGTRKPTGRNYVAKNPYGPRGTTREKIAQLLEDRGAMRCSEIAKEIGAYVKTPYQAMRNHPWFVMNNRKSMNTTWSLTEHGRNRHKTPTESAS